MGRPRKWNSNAERMQANRAFQRSQLSVEQLVAKARAGQIELTASEEQRIRDFWGYAPSEHRTLAERDRAAARMVASIGGLKPLHPVAFPHVEGRDDPDSWSLAPRPEDADQTRSRDRA